ncbi:MAG: hypothetical protein RL301_866 [Actinomycetota bacterium]|jgi:aryl-alcohol dehydrogenase-like predicted oxidoreductase
MELRRAGNHGLNLSRIGLGTMTWGRDTDESEAAEQCRIYIEAGGNFIDTAAVYGSGDSERVVGGLIGALFKRDEVVIATKAGISINDGIRTVNTSRGALLSELDASLKRLGTDYVDLWQVHTWDDQTPIDDTLSALETAYQSGKARYVGVSNYSGWQIAYSAIKAPIATIQNEYSLLNREPEREVLAACDHLGLGFLAWSPLGRGVLTGKYRNGIPSDSRAASAHFANFVEGFLNDKSRTIVEAVQVAADGLGYSPTEIALSWVRDSFGVTSAIVGARTAAQLKGAIRAEEISLPDIVRQALNEVSTI